MSATVRATPAGRLIGRVETLRRTQPERAWQTLRRSFAAASRATGDAERGELWRLRGHVLRSLRKTRAAADAYRRAERWFERAGAVRERGRCAIGLVDALMYLGRYREALRVARRGRRLLARAGDHASLARLANNEGNIFHRLDLPERALARYRDARRRLRQARDSRGMAMVEGNIANCLSMLGRNAEARALYVGAGRAHAAAGFKLDALNANYNLAYLDFLDHDYEAALEALDRVRGEAGRCGYPSLAALATLDRAEILLRMGAYSAALAEAESTIRECGALGLSYERSKAETFAALAEHRLGQRVSAISRLERSLAAFHAEGNQVWTGETLVGLATIWLRDENPRAAAALLAAAGRWFARAGDHEREACSLALLACARLEAGETAAAQACLGKLRNRGRAAASPRLRHLTLAAEASLARAQGNVRRARERLRRAAAEAERLAARILEEQWRSSFWGEWGWPHLELTALELGEGRIAAALEALEHGRGRALVGVFGRTTGAGRVIRSSRVRRWAALQQARERGQLARPEGRFGTRRPARPSLAVGKGLKRALQSLPGSPLRAEALQRALPEDQLLVDYFLHRGVLGAFAVTRDRIVARTGLIHERELARRVHSLLFDLRGDVFDPAARGIPARELGGRLGELSALLLWPLLREHPGDAGPASLAVVPVGSLARLPWAAFPLPDGRALCEAMELVVAPGLRLSRIGAAAGIRESPDEDRRDPPLVIASDAGDLRNVEREARAVTAHFPGARLLAGRDASASRFLELAPRARWIHFAGHGHFRPDAPHESALRFADRWLLADELAGLRLSASWVGLSACQTARALVHPGEEWFGLARSFLLSGARTVLASQWDIDDGAAARLMADVYRRLAAGDSLGRSLSGAQATCFRDGLPLLEWAGYVMLGGPAAQSAPRGRPRNGDIQFS